MATLVPFFKVPAKKRKAPVLTCDSCGLYKDCISPRMEATGDCEKGIFILAEAPGKTEDEQGTQLVGKSGKRLRRELARLDIDLDRDCRKMNAVNCWPHDKEGKNRTPTDKEIACCRSRVMDEIKKCNPKVILALGGQAMKCLCQHRAAFDTGFPPMANWEGECIPDQELQAWIIPTWHPAYILRLDGSELHERRWRKALKKAAEMAAGERPAIYPYENMVECIINPAMAARRLTEIYAELQAMDNPQVAFDYETTGLKPYVEGHEIVCCSLAYKPDQAISFMVNDVTWPMLYRILRSDKIGKMAHNIKFEHLWTLQRGWPQKKMGFRVHNWQWDSMLAAHILDNRTGKAGLKLQAYLQFGVLGYDDDAGPYIRTGPKDKALYGANAFNKVKELPVEDLLLYCAYDSLFEYRLAKWQMEEVKNAKLQNACDLFFKGAVALTEAENNGIRVDTEYYEKQSAYLARRIEQKKCKIDEYPEVQKWHELYGDKFNLASTPQLGRLLYDELGIKAKKTTDKGKASVDKTVLEDMDIPFVQDLLELRKLEKMKSTYIDGLKVEAPDGWLHPFFHLHKVVSFRSASSNPNFGLKCLEVLKPCELMEHPDRAIMSQAHK